MLSLSNTYIPLGETLQEAGLISKSQLELALRDQSFYQYLKIGEILALRGWIEKNTADFFADSWHNLVEEKTRHPLGHYLRQANLLQEEQINTILKEQNQLWIRFGSIAVLKGWLKQNTLDFFLQNLFPTKLASSPFIGKRQSNLSQITYNSEPQINLETSLLLDQTQTAEIDYEDIPWVD
ncbi:MAG: hypothetical protein QNJ34_27920 [Xenococcaceae cyanobacterium MO_188.B29]|nr:hypothetical protein [Xenococcaceae cyanobacterium MO_188.B29]